MRSTAANQRKRFKHGEPTGTALAWSIEDYLQACRARGVRLSTIRNAYGNPLRRSFLPWAVGQGVTDPAGVDQRIVEAYAAHLRDDGGKDGRQLSENTVWTYLKSLRQYVAWVHEEDGGAPRVRLRKPPGRKVDVLEREDIKRLERTAAAERDRVIVRVLADTGMRPGELCSITGGSLRRDSRRHYARVEGKTGIRDVPVQPELWRRMKGLAREDGDPIFVGLRRDPRTKHVEPLTPHGVAEVITRLAEESGLRQHVTPYTFRHSACRWMLLSGLSTVEVEAILGHGSDRMIREHYANIGRDDAHDRLMQLLRAES